MVEDRNDYEGPERRKQNQVGRRDQDQPIHPWRWRALITWIVIFTLATGYGLRTNRKLIHEGDRSSVKLHAVQKTNCGLTLFLLTARKARWTTYRKTHLKSDLQAVQGYEKLVEPFLADPNSIGDDCKVSQRLKIPGRPLSIERG